ncbi:MAG: BamA/TamA family outer membrane protein [Stigonema ocellatum SAG 48.90 = DSM 106950]|nr:BamA/TamA family outer membrane protein [Stigonema ocellatum SAG 48.90 = DSM 106950]
MRVSPVLVTVVAMAAPLGGSLSANAQTFNNAKQKTEAFTSPTNQEHLASSLGGSLSINAQTFNNAKQKLDVFPSLINQSHLAAPLGAPLSTNAQTFNNAKQKLEVFPSPRDEESKVVRILPATPTLATKPKVILPTPTTLKTAQNPPQSTPVPDIPPPNAQPQIPNPASPNTPIPNNPNQSAPEPIPPTTPNNTPPDQAPEANETRVLVSEVFVKAETGQLSPDLENLVYRAIRTQPGRTTTRSQLQEDINSVFATGFFSNVQALPEDTPLGVRVSFVVRPNPVLTKVQVQANPGTNVSSVLPNTGVNEIFRNQYGKILNLRDLQEGIKQLTKRYQDQGYVLANVIGSPQVSDNGVVTLQVAEGVVENIRVRFRNKQGQETNQKGQPIRARTRTYIITRELQLKPGQIFNRNTIQKDLQRVYGLGLFEDVNVSLDPGTDPSKVDVVVNVVERNSGSIGAGAGISSASGIFGTVSYQQNNLNGRNQKLGAEIQVGQLDTFLFDLRFTDPWIAGDPYRTSYTADIFRRQSISLIFDGPKTNIATYDPKNPNTINGDRPRIVRLGGGVNFTRPLSKNPFSNSEWVASAGFQYQRVSVQDSNGNLRSRGELSNSTDCLTNVTNSCINLTQSGGSSDDLLLLQLGAARDRRNNPLTPTSGSFLRLGLDQSVPIGEGNILLSRVRGSYSQYLPLKLLKFSKKPEALAFNIQGGTVIGDLPPYEAFSLGGSNSVRGYDEGQLGSGRSFVQTSLEYRFPIFSIVSGALFFDFGSDLGTSTRPSVLLNKNGTGYGYGLGVRVQSPLGPIRIDYGINDDGGSRINFGIGERF